MDGWGEGDIGGRGLNVDEGRRVAEDRVRWRAVVRGEGR